MIASRWCLSTGALQILFMDETLRHWVNGANQ